MQFVMVRGNPVDGFLFVGPYESREEAIKDGDIVDTEWWVAELESAEWDEAEESALETVAKVKAPALADDEDWD